MTRRTLKDYIVDYCIETWGLSEDTATQVVLDLAAEDPYLAEKMGYDSATFFDTPILRLVVHRKIDSKAKPLSPMNARLMIDDSSSPWFGWLDGEDGPTIGHGSTLIGFVYSANQLGYKVESFHLKSTGWARNTVGLMGIRQVVNKDEAQSC